MLAFVLQCYHDAGTLVRSRACVLPKATLTVLSYALLSYMCVCVARDSESPFKLNHDIHCHKQGIYNHSVRMGH